MWFTHREVIAEVSEELHAAIIKYEFGETQDTLKSLNTVLVKTSSSCLDEHT